MRILAIWLLETMSLLILATLGFGLEITSFWAAVVAVAFIALLNALVRPTLVRLTLPITTVTMGLFSLFINAFLLLVVSAMLPGLVIDSLWDAVWVSIGLSILNTVFSYVFSVSDDNSYYYGVIKKAARRNSQVKPTTQPGFLYIEIDGLGHEVFKLALKLGLMPQLKRYLTTNNYQIEGWETDFTPQTCACQAGILHGNNNNIPAFRWFDRSAGKIVSAGSLRDSLNIEKECSNGQGLLKDGMSINNMFSGDAPNGVLTVSMILKKRDKTAKSLQYYFLNPYNYAHTLVSVVRECLAEIKDARYAKKYQVEPSISHRNWKFMLMRSVLNVYLADISFAVAIGEMLSGTPTIYLTAAGYDDIAHHTGVLSPEALSSLRRLDTYLSHIFQALKDAPRPYHIILLSDHGQSNGTNFMKAYGQTLAAVVGQSVTAKTEVGEIEDHDESYTNANKLLTEISSQFQPKKPMQVGRIGAKDEALRRVKGDRSAHNHSDQISTAYLVGESAKDALPEILVLASGNLGLIYLTKSKKRLSLEEIVSQHPELVKKLVGHPGISFVMVKTKNKGTVVLSKKGAYYLKTDQVEGKNPLTSFDDSLVTHMKRYDTFTHTPDIVVNSAYLPETEEVLAFEDFVGSHGGIGGPQNKPFVAYPPVLSRSRKPIIGTEKLHQQLVAWQKEVGVRK